MAATYLALLRGINVGGANIIRMAELKRCFEEAGFDRVVTYIQSGNVVFSANGRDVARIASQIESLLSARFGYASKVVVVSSSQLQHVVEHAPDGFGDHPDAFRYDVIFLRPPLRPEEALRQVPVTEGVDQVHAGRDVLYFSRLIAKATQSKLARIVSLPIYKEMTIRNWNTTTKLLDLMPSR